MLALYWVLLLTALLAGCSDSSLEERPAAHDAAPTRLILNLDDAESGSTEPDAYLLTQWDAAPADAQIPDSEFVCSQGAAEECDLGEGLFGVCRTGTRSCFNNQWSPCQPTTKFAEKRA